MRSHFTSDFFVSNRRRLRELSSSDSPIVITANGLLQRGGDSSYSFCQDANFWYLTGIDEPNIILVMEAEAEYLIVPERDASRTTFDGALDDVTLTARSGVSEILETKAGWERLENLASKTESVQTIAAAPAYIARYGIYANPARSQLIEMIVRKVPGLKILDITSTIVRQRMVKQPPELLAIQMAIDITIKSIKSATSATKLKRYHHEYELEAEIGRGFRSLGAGGHSFEPIVAGGERACTLHNVANNSPFKRDELVVIDVGAEVEHYAADITRTVCLGIPSARFRAIHQAVANVQQFAFGLLKPGVILAEYEQAIEDYMGTILVELGLIKAINHDAVRAYYPHAASHFLGLNVHDAGDYDMPLAPGMVLTVEPGIYIPEEGVGVRIEDDVLITRTGIKILSRRLPSALA